MIEAIKDIRQKLLASSYKNEEHVRLNLILRLLYKLGWDIWNPFEVDTEFVVYKQDDNTKVDFALRPINDYPSVFIEVKAVGKIINLADVEMQLLNYNKYNTAPFSIITDGKNWYFYFSQSGGSMAQKRFKEINLLNTDINEIAETFNNFLSKEEIINGNAEAKAKEYLTYSRELRAIKDCEVAAEKLTRISPYPRLPEAILNLMKEKGYSNLTLSKIEEYLSNEGNIDSPIASSNPITRPTGPIGGGLIGEKVESLSPPPDVKFATIVDGAFNGKEVKDWNKLLETSINECFLHGLNVSQIQRSFIGNIRDGLLEQNGYKFISAFNYSFQRMDANNCLSNAVKIAKHFRCPLTLKIKWGIQGIYPDQVKSFRLN